MRRQEKFRKRSGATVRDFDEADRPLCRHPEGARGYLAPGGVARLPDSAAIRRTRAWPGTKSPLVTNVHLMGPDPSLDVRERGLASFGTRHIHALIAGKIPIAPASRRRVRRSDPSLSEIFPIG